MHELEATSMTVNTFVLIICTSIGTIKMATGDIYLTTNPGINDYWPTKLMAMICD